MPNDPAEGQAPWDAGLYEARHAFVWQRAADLLPLLGPQPGERILDLGCGTGHLTARIAEAGAHVRGIDSSPEMIQEARSNYPHLEFVVADATDFHFREPFDAVFSNAALHWMREPERVVESIRSALKPGGRFVAEMGGKGNVKRLIGALRQARADLGCPLSEGFTPWYFPSVGEYASLLEAHGLEVTFASLFDRPTALGEKETALGDWIRMFGAAFTAGLSAQQEDKLIRRTGEFLRKEFFRDGVWHADYRRLRFAAWKRIEGEGDAAGPNRRG